LEIIVNFEFKIIFDNITNGGSRPPCAQPRKDENGVEEERGQTEMWKTLGVEKNQSKGGGERT
jgi:hypothetical protein